MTQKNENNGGVVKAGVVGAMTGAAIAATAILLSDEKNRKVIQKKAKEVQVWTDKTTKGLKKKALEMRSSATDTVETLTDKGQDMLEDANTKGKRLLSKSNDTSSSRKTAVHHAN
jgi:gas vesicle protein